MPNGRSTSRACGRRWRTGTAVLLTLSTISIAILCHSCAIGGKVELAPLPEKALAVGKLANGNWEVTEAFILEHSLLLAQRRALIIELERRGVQIVETER